MLIIFPSPKPLLCTLQAFLNLSFFLTLILKPSVNTLKQPFEEVRTRRNVKV